MRATALEVTATTATVLLEPGWLRRLFGARPALVELRRAHAGRDWACFGTGRPLHRIPHGSVIENALSLRAAPMLPAARAIERVSRSGSWLAPGSRE